MANVSARREGGRMFRLLKLSIAAKLYTIFALLGVSILTLAAVALFSSFRHAELTAEVEAASQGALYAERVDGLIYAVVMESRGIYMSPDVATARKFSVGLLKFNERIGEVMKMWQASVRD